MPTLGCLDCSRQFYSIDALQSHCSATYHRFGCKPCGRQFPFLRALEQHIHYSPAHDDSDDDDQDSSTEDYESSEEEEEDSVCLKCNRIFVDIASLNQHLLNNPVHNWCFLCSRDFKTAQALNQHSLSSVHKERGFDCLFCDKEFGTPSAVAMHIESGCHKVTRHQVTAAVHKLKVVPNISVNRRLEGPILPPATIITYLATELAFNGSAYECYLCHRTFATLGRLNAHFNSPAHDDDEFKCPNAKCGSEFKLVSGLIQHIESETCGLAKFKEVRSQFESLTDMFSRSLKF